ncbi:hypothetical protein ACIPQH_16810 [Streptomyces rubiginosohelvolus]|uniref:hypothetical protein n=1 Tax=Streptomyces TaxID=1883 RepID=UPI001CD7719F|nr:hypothetical protein [Streptomyces sp. 7G]MCA1272399.1 hypothetical protein [Streptomyces sp. 7G]
MVRGSQPVPERAPSVVPAAIVLQAKDDSEEYSNEESWEDDEPGAAGCPCGSEEFEAAVAFSLGDGGSVRWVTVGLRCIKDGFCGAYADWKIDYGPTDHLLTTF